MKTTFFKQILIVMISIFFMACPKPDDPINEDEEDKTYALEFDNWTYLDNLGEGEFSYKNVIYENSFYACTGKDGLYKMDLCNTSPHFEYLGLADSSGLYPPIWTISDVAILYDTLLVARYYIRSAEVETTVGILKKIGDGPWAAFDAGIVDSTQQNESTIWGIKRSPHNPKILVAVGNGGAVFNSTTAGLDWTTEFSSLSLLGNGYKIIWHPENEGEIWKIGSSVFSSPILIPSYDFGYEWDQEFMINLSPLGGDTHVYDLLFKKQNNNSMYMSSYYGVLYSDSAGSDWLNQGWYEDDADEGYTKPPWIMEFEIDGPKYGGMTHIDEIPNQIFIAKGSVLYWSMNNGESFSEVNGPNEERIYSINYINVQNILIAQTETGFYSLQVIINEN